ncbi:MAG: murein biosynthesis integral membrane protein MurJ [Bryobacteraceae bacterium]
MQVRIRIMHGRQPSPAVTESSARPTLGASSLVALGILVSRITGLLRESVVSHYFGVHTIAADAFRAATRIPNMLNNLFGEGVLSAAFITVYSKLRATDQDEEAEHLAEVVFGILSVVCAVLVLLGITLTPLLTAVIVPGFTGDKRALTIRLVRILFPGTGLLVLSAWCLGVLNSHRQFLLSYLAPVAMNLTMIIGLVLLGQNSVPGRLVIDLAWAYLLGSVLQFLIQVPRVLQYLPNFRPALELQSQYVRSVIRNFGPVFLSRGVVQISSTVDQMIASLLPGGAVAALGYGQVIALLPVSLFSMSVSAAELPALSSVIGTDEEVAVVLRKRLSSGLRRIAFFVIPSAVAFLLLGDVLTAALYQSGKFTHADAVEVWLALGGSSVGLLATGLGRLYSSAFYALLDTRTPLRFAVIRIALTVSLGWLFALYVPRWLGLDPMWGIAGLTASAGIAGWVEFILLRRGLSERIGKISLPTAFTFRLWAVAFVAALLGYGCKLLLGTAHPRLLAAFVVTLFGAVYFAGTTFLGIEESRTTVNIVLRRFRR